MRGRSGHAESPRRLSEVQRSTVVRTLAPRGPVGHGLSWGSMAVGLPMRLQGRTLPARLASRSRWPRWCRAFLPSGISRAGRRRHIGRSVTPFRHLLHERWEQRSGRLYMGDRALITHERARLHRALIDRGVLAVNAEGIATNADKGNKASCAIASLLAGQLMSETHERPGGPDVGFDVRGAACAVPARHLPQAPACAAWRVGRHPAGKPQRDEDLFVCAVRTPGIPARADLGERSTQDDSR